MSGDQQVVVYIGVGSNLQNPQQQVTDALTLLDNMPETVCARVSSLYRSRPMGPADQPDYINAVAELKTTLSARILLQHLQDIEARQGRVRGAERWGPRTLDLDILLYNHQVICESNLVVPHPGIPERAFVLYPLQQLAPDIEIPGLGSLKDIIDIFEQTKKGEHGLERIVLC